MAVVLPFSSREPKSRDWDNNELSELYRVEHALVQASIALETDRGLTDEGDPWFVFCRAGGDVLVHIARFDGLYHLISPALPAPISGTSFTALTRSFVSEVPLSPRTAANSRIALHPSALLSLLVVTIFFSLDHLTGESGRAEAKDLDHSLTTRHASLSLKERQVQSVAVNLLGGFVGFSVLGADEVSWIAAQAAVLASVGGLFDGAIPVHSSTTDLVESAPVSDQTVADSVVTETTGWHVDSLAATRDSSRDTNSVATAALAARQSLTEYDALDRITAEEAATLTLVAERSATRSSGLSTLASLPFPDVASSILVSGRSSSEHLTVDVGDLGGVLDLQSASGVKVIELTGSGVLSIVGLSGDGSQMILLTNASISALSLHYASTSSDADLAQTIVVANGSTVAITAVSVTGASEHKPNLALTIDNTGSSANTISVADGATSAVQLNLVLVGSQDITVKEGVGAFEASHLDASGLGGQLTVGIDFTGTSHTTTLVGSSSFVVNDNGIVVLLHVPDGANIQLGTSLQSVVAQLDGSSSSSTLSINLHSTASEAKAVSIGTFKVEDANHLVLHSDGAAGISNTVNTLMVSSLSDLKITGDASLSIKGIVGITEANLQSVTIDASGLNGNLTLDASQIVDSVTGGRSVIIIGGDGNDALTNTVASEDITLSGGDGIDTFCVGAGAYGVTITDLAKGETVRVGNGSAQNTLVDTTNLQGADQSHLDSLSLTNAASSAATVAGYLGTHQSVLFVQNKETYVFFDANGDHHFDAVTDAIVHLLGVVSASELTHVNLLS